MKKIMQSLFISTLISTLGVLAVPATAVFADPPMDGGTSGGEPYVEPSEESKSATFKPANDEANRWNAECQKHTGWATEDECTPIADQYFMDYWNWSAREYAYAMGENVERVAQPAQPHYPVEPRAC